MTPVPFHKVSPTDRGVVRRDEAFGGREIASGEEVYGSRGNHEAVRLGAASREVPSGYGLVTGNRRGYGAHPVRAPAAEPGRRGQQDKAPGIAGRRDVGPVDGALTNARPDVTPLAAKANRRRVVDKRREGFRRSRRFGDEDRIASRAPTRGYRRSVPLPSRRARHRFRCRCDPRSRRHCPAVRYPKPSGAPPSRKRRSPSIVR